MKRTTRVVHIGDTPLGGNHPIRIQSMTTTNTMDTEATVAQCVKIIRAGADYVRITAPGLKEAQNLEVIKKGLRKRGYNTPLIADIHYTPNAALLAARIVEKVRINPGNYADRKRFRIKEYTDAEYNAELERISERFIPLLKVCKKHGTAMRIGVNHGSLSDRIMNRYGDTPLGMVETALEFVRICERQGYYDIVLSMKASNPVVMVHANRLLVNKMQEEGMNYPLHLGVTEAGEGEDGRIKSAVGIGTLLEQSIGDTIRVSLTEEPEYEIPVAKALADRYPRQVETQKELYSKGLAPDITQLKTGNSKPEIFYNPFEYNKRKTNQILNIGGSNVPIVIADFSEQQNITETTLSEIGYNYSTTFDKWKLSDTACDYLYLGNNKPGFKFPETLGVIYNPEIWKTIENKKNAYPLFHAKEYLKADYRSKSINFVEVDTGTLTQDFINEIKDDKTIVLVFETPQDPQGFRNFAGLNNRRLFFELIAGDCAVPVIIKRNYENLSYDDLLLYAAADIGGLLLDGFGDGIWLRSAIPSLRGMASLNNIAFGILQAARTRITKTEYISCPSCGRTLFNLQETTAKIRSRTENLKGVKIGIMGCIVNGPGEMADADYGYVGTGPGKITLYKGKDVIKRNVPEEQAVEALIELMKEKGDWVG